MDRGDARDKHAGKECRFRVGVLTEVGAGGV
jgi:hypothetical protein